MLGIFWMVFSFQTLSTTSFSLSLKINGKNIFGWGLTKNERSLALVKRLDGVWGVGCNSQGTMAVIRCSKNSSLNSNSVRGMERKGWMRKMDLGITRTWSLMGCAGWGVRGSQPDSHLLSQAILSSLCIHPLSCPNERPEVHTSRSDLSKVNQVMNGWAGAPIHSCLIPS